MEGKWAITLCLLPSLSPQTLIIALLHVPCSVLQKKSGKCCGIC